MFGIPDLLMMPVSWLVKSISLVPVIRRTVSRIIINKLASATPPRPRPFSMAAGSTTWPGLTNRRFTGRHLRITSPTSPQRLPPGGRLSSTCSGANEFARSTDTSAMFMFFAQWFTDSFLRTDHTDFRKNTSNHEIDLCQIYGLTEDADQLSAGARGRSAEEPGHRRPASSRRSCSTPRAPGGAARSSSRSSLASTTRRSSST